MLEELFSKFDEISIYWRSKRSADNSIQKVKRKLMMEAASFIGESLKNPRRELMTKQIFMASKTARQMKMNCALHKLLLFLFSSFSI